MGGSLNAADSTKFAAMKLEKVGHALASAIPIAPTYRSPRGTVPHGPMSVEAANEIIAPFLTEVAGDLDTSSAANFGPQRLLVGGAWIMHQNARAILTACRMASEALKENPDLYL